MKIDKIIKMNKSQLKQLSEKSEHTIQCECVNYARSKDLMIFAIPNEATRNNSKFIKSGVLAGVSDLILVLPNKILFVEMKTSKGVQSKYQKVFQKNIEVLGFEYKIIRSLDEFKFLIP